MKTTTLGRFLSPFLFCAVLLSCAAKGTATEEIVPLGDNTYSVARIASNTFMRDMDKLQAQAREAAEKFCADQGKQMKVVSMTSERPWMTVGFFKAKLVFKALNPGEPEPAAPAVPTTAAVLSNSGSTGSDDMYSALIKLDDLRKKGILTDKEFEKQKKKILKGSD